MTKARELSELGSFLNVESGVATVNNMNVTANLQVSVVVANGSIGTAGQMLTSNGSGVYWLTPQIGDITNVIAGTGLTGGGSSGEVTISLATSGVVANTYGNSSQIPVVTVDTYGRVTNVSTTAVAGVTNFTYAAANNTFTISTGDGSNFLATVAAANATTLGVVTVLDSLVNTSILIAASANSVKTAYDTAISANTRAASAQTAAISAYSNATSYADSVAATAYSNAVSVAASDATAKAANAYSNAISTASTDATNKAANAYSNAVSYAGTIAGTAYSNAVSVAATDATTKANNAYTTAVAAAASDATTKANNAYTTAVSTASSDATNKAANAYSNATSFASNASNISSGTLAEARLPFRMNQNVRTTDSVTFANGSFTGSLNVSGDLIVTGNLESTNVQSLAVADPLMKLGVGNAGDVYWGGFTFHYSGSGNTTNHAGLVRSPSTKEFILMSTYGDETNVANNNAINVADPSFSYANLQVNILKAGNSTVFSTVNATSFTGTANNTSFVGSVAAANVVSNTQLSSNLANYQTTAGLSGNVATLTSNNATYFNGLDSSRFIYGNNVSGSTLASNTQDVYEVAQRKSGFWDAQPGATWSPDSGASYWWGATFAHVSNSPSYNYSGQLAFRNGLGGNDIQARTISNGTPSAWARLLSSGNYTSYAMPIGSSAVNTVDVRAPIFYDSNDTGYFVDPNSTSSLTNLNVLNDIYITRTTNAYGYIVRPNSAGYKKLQFAVSGGGQLEEVLSNAVSTISTGDMRATIYYDYSDTGYYVNPNGSSNVFGEFTINQNTVSGLQIKTTAGTQSLWVRAGYDTDGSATPVVSATNIQFQSSGSSGGTFTFVTGNTKAITILGDYAQGAGSLRAPIFYDSNNTAYYCDPNSISRLSSFLLGGNETYVYEGSTNGLNIRTGATGAFKYFGFESGGRFVVSNGGMFSGGYFQVEYNSGNQFAGMGIRNNYGSASLQATNFIDFINENGIQKASLFGRIATDGAGYLEFLSTAAGVSRSTDSRTTTAYAYFNQWQFQTAAGITANIFYDRDNTGFYLDPNSTTNLSGLSVANTISGYVSGAKFSNDSENKADITTRTESGFWQSDTGTIAEGWPLDTNGWQHMLSVTHTNDANYFAMQLGSGFYSQGLFYRATNGSGTTAWSRVALYDNPYGSNLRATIFYDNDNTGYYVDAASTTNLNSFQCGNFVSSDSAPTWTNEGLQYVEHLSSHLAYYKKAGIYNYYWRRSDSGYAGGANDTTMMQLNDSGTLTVLADVRAPIFYDSNDTGYYIDPNTTATSVNVRGEINNPTLWVNDGDNSNSYNEGIRLRDAPNGISVIALSAPGAAGEPRFSLLSYSTYLETRKAGTWETRLFDGYEEARGSYRAPIFYDSNNTGYYINPNGTSVLYNMEMINMRCSFSRQWDNYPGISVYNTTDQGPQGDFRIFGSVGANGGDFSVRLLVDGEITSLSNVNAGAAMYSPIYYDSNNTGYYYDGAGTSILNTTYINGKFYARGGVGVDECCGSDATISVGGSAARPPSISWHYSGVMQGNMQGNQTGWRKIYFYDDQGNGLGVHATGQIASNADVIAYYSDKRLKKDLVRVVDHWNVINNLTGYRFTWNEKSGEIPGFQDKVGKREVGLIAQDVQAVYPEAIAMRTEGPEEDPYMTIKHDRFTAVFIEALKDLRKELDQVKEENKRLREMINGQ